MSRRTGNYWFLEDSETLASALEEHHSGWNTNKNVMSANWERNLISYYSTLLEAGGWESALGTAGEYGELVKMVVPQARSFIRQRVALVTKQRLFFKTIAQNEDEDVLQATRIGNSLCEQIVNDQGLDEKREYNVESAAVLGMSFYKVTWRSDKGTPYAGSVEDKVDAEGNEFKTPVVHYDGDLEISTPSVYDVYWDSRINRWKDLNWAECRTIKNRWDMVASYPDIEEEIRCIPEINESNDENSSNCGDDLIYVYECYHKPSPALPLGRMIVYSDSKTIYSDGPNPYETIPIIPLKPEPIIGKGYGYAKINDLLPAQEMYDMSLSAIATNTAAHAVQNIACPRDAGVTVGQIDGSNWIYYTETSGHSGGLPTPLQLSKSAPETFKFIDIMKANMADLSEINSTVRGSPPPGITSGTALATLTANSLEFMNSLSKKEQFALEEVMWLGVFCYAKFSTVPRLVSLIGRGNQSFAKEFVGSDISCIKKVRMIVSNPLMNTIGGRAEIAEKMLANGMIKNPQEYFRVLEGAPTEVLFSEEMSQEDLIHRENEALLDGRPVIPLFTDDHAAHIKSHAALLNDPMVRYSGQQVSEILDHNEKHANLARTMDPFMAAMLATGKMPQGMDLPGAQPPPGAEGPTKPTIGPGPVKAPSGKAPAPGGEMPLVNARAIRPAAKPAEPSKDLLQGER